MSYNSQWRIYKVLALTSVVHFAHDSHCPFIIWLYFPYISNLPACVYVNQVSVHCFQRSEDEMDSLELELLMVENHVNVVL